MNKLWQELQRRHVVRVGIVYVTIAWILAQVADLGLDNFNAPEWIIQSFLLLLVSGFPVVLLLAWVYELTPQGLRRDVSASTDADANHQTTSTSSTVLRFTIWAVAAVSFAALILLSVRFADQWRSEPEKQVNPRVVVTLFENGTGDASLDSIGRLTADMISQGLQRTGIVDVVPPNTALHLSRTLTGRDDGAGDPVTRLATETGATHAVSGTYYLNGDTIQFHAQIHDMRNSVRRRQHVAIEPVSAQSDRPGEAIEALRQRVMGAMASIIDPRIEQPTELMGHMPVYKAYRAFIEGLELFWHSDFANAQPHFQRAIELDPAYHLPGILLILTHYHLDEWEDAERVVAELERHRDELSPYEAYRLDQMVAGAEGDLAGAYRAARQAASISPEFGPVYDGAAFAIALNRPQEAIEAFHTIDTSRVLIGWAAYWELLTTARHMLGDHVDELNEALEGRAQYPDSLNLIFTETRARAALGDLDGTQQLINASIKLAAQPGWTVGGLMRVTGEELIAHGQAEAGQELLAQAINWYKTRPTDEMETRRYSLAVTLLAARELDESITLLELLEQEEPGRFFVLGALGTAYAIRGDREAAERINELLEAMEIPHSFGSISAWQAQIAASLGNREQAVAYLQRAFSQGTNQDEWLHRQLAFRPLIDYPPFKALLQPDG